MKSLKAFHLIKFSLSSSSPIFFLELVDYKLGIQITIFLSDYFIILKSSYKILNVIVRYLFLSQVVYNMLFFDSMVNCKLDKILCLNIYKLNYFFFVINSIILEIFSIFSSIHFFLELFSYFSKDFLFNIML